MLVKKETSQPREEAYYLVDLALRQVLRPLRTSGFPCTQSEIYLFAKNTLHFIQHFFIHNLKQFSLHKIPNIFLCTYNFEYCSFWTKFICTKSGQNVFPHKMKQFCESSAIFVEKINVWGNLHRTCLLSKLNRFLSHFISTLAKVFAKYQHIFNIIAFRITSIITNTIFYIFTNSIILITIIMSSAKPSHAVVFYYLEIPFSVGWTGLQHILKQIIS